MQCQEKAAETLDELLETALAPKTDAVKRRGAAMGVGATVKGPAGAVPAVTSSHVVHLAAGIGIQAVRQHNILKTIEAAAEDTDHPFASKHIKIGQDTSKGIRDQKSMFYRKTPKKKTELDVSSKLPNILIFMIF
jgi:hypothetical protein